MTLTHVPTQSWSCKIVACGYPHSPSFTLIQPQSGPLGSADAVKAVNNIMNAAHVLVAAEGLLALTAYGVDPAIVQTYTNIHEPVRPMNVSDGQSDTPRDHNT